MRGWVFLPIRTRPLIMLRGEPPLAQFVPFSDTGGEYTPRARVSRGDRAMVGGGEGGRYPYGAELRAGPSS